MDGIEYFCYPEHQLHPNVTVYSRKYHYYCISILTVITPRWLYTHGKTLIDTWHPLTNTTMLTHLVQLANLWMDWFFISIHTAKCKELKANFIARTNFIRQHTHTHIESITYLVYKIYTCHTSKLPKLPSL